MDDPFVEIRALLSLPPSWSRWNRLVAILDTWKNNTSRSLALDYIREHIDDAWPYRWRPPNASWPGGSTGWELSRTESRELKSFPEVELVFCPSGTYQPGMQEGKHESLPEFVGLTKEQWPLPRVGLTHPFWCQTTPVTQHLWENVMGTNPSDTESPFCPVVYVSWRDTLEFCNRLSILEGFEPVYEIRDNSPLEEPTVEGFRVSWKKEADGYRLPTNAEWEWACRAGSDTLLYGPLSEIALTSDNTDSLQPVARKKPNTWLLYDMIGHVFEWCWDVSLEFTAEDSEDASEEKEKELLLDPRGAEEGLNRVARGGSFLSSLDFLNAVAQRSVSLTSRQEDLGFRVVRTATQ